MDQRKSPPVASQIYSHNSVSEYRRAQMSGEADKKIFKSGDNISEEGLTPASYAVPGISKFSQLASATTNAFRGSLGNSVVQNPEVYSPLWLTSNMNLPRDRATINAWCRSFYALNPIVQNAINLHSTYPISKLNIKCHNKKVEKFFNEMCEELDLMNICTQVAQEYWLLGEAFVYASMDEKTAKWNNIILQNPDYIVLRRSVINGEPIIMLRPDENLRRICFSTNASDIEQRKQLNDTIVSYVKKGQNIPLDNFFVSHLARKISPYEPRGTGLPVSIFRTLMLFDELRECKFAQAQTMVNPMQIIKIGGADGGYKPTALDLEAWRQAYEAASADKSQKIFTHEAVVVDTIGAAQGIYDTSADVSQLMKEIYAGLYIPQIVIEGGGDITYANGGISLDILRARYMQFRNMMAAWLKRKIFQPISKLNEFYEYKDGEKTLIIPEVEWNHMSLFDVDVYVNNLVQLTGEQKRVSLHTLYRSLGLDFEDEKRKIRKEDICEAIREKEKESLKKMPLNTIRTLKDEDDIPEITDDLLPGERGNNDKGSDLPGMDSSSAPPDLTPPPEVPGSSPAP